MDDEVLDAAVEESFSLVLNSSDAAFGGSETTVDTSEVIIMDTTGTKVGSGGGGGGGRVRNRYKGRELKWAIPK